MAATLCSEWGGIDGQLQPQQLPLSAQFGCGEPAPPFSPEFILDYLLFDGPEVEGNVLFSDCQFNPDLHPAMLPPSSDVSQAPLPQPMDWYGGFCFPPSFVSESDLLLDGSSVGGDTRSYPELIGGAAPHHYPEPAQRGLIPAESFIAPQLQNMANGGEKPTAAAGGACPSAQSTAARQRRKRISEKTQELGQLIPGAGRMNTAEMLQTAFKYVKFLQAQIGMLDLAESCFSQEELGERGEDVVAGEAPAPELLQALLAEPLLQEKLAGEELCLVPTRLVKALSEDQVTLARPSIARDLQRLLH